VAALNLALWSFNYFTHTSEMTILTYNRVSRLL